MQEVAREKVMSLQMSNFVEAGLAIQYVKNFES